MDVKLVIFQLVVFQAAANQYYESDSTSKWEDANRRCNLATPDIDATSDGYSVHIDYNLTHGAVWIGYFKMLTVFEYIGCAVIDSQQHSQTINLTRQYNSPGLCYSKCRGKEIIGVSLDKCICLDSVQSHYLERQCNMTCGTGSESFLCGGKYHMSIYMVNKNETAGIGNRQCLSFERYQAIAKRWSWRDCSYYLTVLCENETIGVKVGKTSYTWKKAVQTCFQNDFHPTSYQALRQTQLTVIPSWSGIISSDVIYTSKEWRSSYTGVRFGYVRANKTVDFTDNNDMMFPLCNRSVTEQRSTSTLLPTSIAGSTASNQAVSTSVSSETDATVETTSSTAGSDVGVVVGVSVAAVLLVTALILAFVFLRRRRKFPNLCLKFGKTTDSKNADPSIPSYVNVINVIPRKGLGREKNNASDDINDSNHTYLALEPRGNDSETYDTLVSGH